MTDDIEFRREMHLTPVGLDENGEPLFEELLHLVAYAERDGQRYVAYMPIWDDVPELMVAAQDALARKVEQDFTRAAPLPPEVGSDG